MSFKALTWAATQRLGNPVGTSILMMLANHADDAGQCFPSQKKIAEECGCGERSARRWIAELERLGLIRTTHRYGKHGYRTSDLFILNLPATTAARSESLPAAVASPTGQSGRASVNQSLNLREKKLVWKITEHEGPKLNRHRESEIWQRCEKLMGQQVPSFMDSAHFPADIVKQAGGIKKQLIPHPS